MLAAKQRFKKRRMSYEGLCLNLPLPNSNSMLLIFQIPKGLLHLFMQFIVVLLDFGFSVFNRILLEIRYWYQILLTDSKGLAFIRAHLEFHRR